METYTHDFCIMKNVKMHEEKYKNDICVAYRVDRQTFKWLGTCRYRHTYKGLDVIVLRLVTTMHTQPELCTLSMTTPHLTDPCQSYIPRDTHRWIPPLLMVVNVCTQPHTQLHARISPIKKGIHVETGLVSTPSLSATCLYPRRHQFIYVLMYPTQLESLEKHEVLLDEQFSSKLQVALPEEKQSARSQQECFEQALH